MKRLIFRLMLVVAVAIAVPAIMPADCLAQGIITPPKSSSKPRPKAKTKSRPRHANAVEVADTVVADTISVEEFPSARTYYRNFDLWVTWRGWDCFFSPDEWNGLPADEKAEYRPMGMVIKADGEDFLIALVDLESGAGFNWDEAVLLYNLPTKEQSDVLTKYKNVVNRRLEAYGGKAMDGFYWTRTEENATYAWGFNMTNGYATIYDKTNLNRVRAAVQNPFDDVGPIEVVADDVDEVVE